ncbi:hypothetical protein K440DRAFT_315762 [Wilcoxina mikolae CBS 423.85]|nr:hypothetical protein K440DRAFT_315762 [Wilcoxina mikolae CBS 423.85]
MHSHPSSTDTNHSAPFLPTSKKREGLESSPLNIFPIQSAGNQLFGTSLSLLSVICRLTSIESAVVCGNIANPETATSLKTSLVLSFPCFAPQGNIHTHHLTSLLPSAASAAQQLIRIRTTIILYLRLLDRITNRHSPNRCSAARPITLPPI